MKVILLQNIKGFGRIGEVKSVSDGHARNFLFPKKMAKAASEGAVKEAAILQSNREAMSAKDKEAAQKAVTILSEAAIHFKKKASTAGTLFSSVGKDDIADQISKLTGMNVTHKMIDLGEAGEHIKQVGEHNITINVRDGLTAKAKVTIDSE
ncbi:MAG: 50S ribosomal protein L9 [Candidatus Pacebacteria bacterium]|nr:50S ribosomal protein L9 [Candidatus Paceibacterota bacterium]